MAPQPKIWFWPKPKNWFWVNYTALLVITVVFHWLVTLVQSDKIFPEVTLNALSAASLFLFGVLAALLGDFGSDPLATKGLKKYVLNVLRPLLSGIWGSAVCIILAVPLYLLFQVGRSVRLHLAGSKSLGLAKVVLYLAPKNSEDITPAISGELTLTQRIRDSEWPRISIADEYGFRRTPPQKISSLFSVIDYLTGSSTDPTDKIPNLDSVTQPLEIGLHYWDSEGNYQEVSSADLDELIKKSLVPKELVEKCTEEIRKLSQQNDSEKEGKRRATVRTTHVSGGGISSS